MSYCWFVQSVYNGAIGKYSQLEELYLLRVPQSSYYSQCVKDIITLQKLESFVSYKSMGNYRYKVKSSRLLHILDFDILMLHKSNKNLLQLPEIVHFDQLSGGFKNVVRGMVTHVGGMKCLKYLRLTNCLVIEHIFDSPSDSAIDLLIPKLVKLVLMGLKILKDLFQGTTLQGLCFFEKLKKLKIQDCHQLNNIFPRECNLPNLTIIKIYNCKFGESLLSICNAQSMHQLEELHLE